MFEIIKVFVEQVFKLINIDSLLKGRDKHKTADVGVELFSLYSNLNSIYVVGTAIVREIDNTIARWDRYRKEERKEEPIEFYHLNDLLQLQQNNIIWFCKDFLHLTMYIDIIDPQTSRTLQLFLSEKSNVLRRLLSVMSPKISSPDTSSAFFNIALERNFLGAINDIVLQPHLRNKEIVDKIHGLREENINFYRLSAKDINFLRGYLRDRKPPEQLESLRLMLDQLYAKLIANFELKDVILRVGQPTPQTSTDNWVPWNHTFRSGVRGSRRPP